jgi:hypothetical protein
VSSPYSDMSDKHNAFVFGYSSANVNMRALHPRPETIKQLWSLYLENCHPVLPALHARSTAAAIEAASGKLGEVDKDFEPLMFAIYHGAVTSLSLEDCKTTLNEDRNVLLTRYRFGLEQALARAGFVSTKDIRVLQAFVIFLVSIIDGYCKPVLTPADLR